MKILKFSLRFSANCVFLPKPQKGTPCLGKLWENYAKIMHFSNFLKKIFKNLRNFFEIFWNFLKFFNIFENFLNFFEYFLKIFWIFFEIFWITVRPEKNPGYAVESKWIRPNFEESRDSQPVSTTARPLESFFIA